MAQGKSVCCYSKPPAGAWNVLVHFEVLEGSSQGKKIFKEICKCGLWGKHDRRPRVRPQGSLWKDLRRMGWAWVYKYALRQDMSQMSLSRVT